MGQAIRMLAFWAHKWENNQNGQKLLELACEKHACYINYKIADQFNSFLPSSLFWNN